MGAQAVIQTNADDSVIIDIGGGSTELSVLTFRGLKNSFSMPLGVIALAEKFMHTDPPTKAQIESIRTETKAVTSSFATQFALPQPGMQPVIIATAGTATTLAAMDLKLREYSPTRINGHVLNNHTAENLLGTIISLPHAQRSTLPGLEPGRETVIIPGILILQHLMNCLGSTTCLVSDAGLLEGIILQQAALKKIIEKT